MIHLATVGTSTITDYFLSAAELTGRFVLSAVYSRARETGEVFAKKHGCKLVYTDLEQLAHDTSVEAVYIASPNVFHAAQSRLFLENGKHVLCEKPIATSAAEYASLKELADRNGLVYMEAIMSRHAAGRKALCQALSQIGNLATVRIDYSQLSSRYSRFIKGEHVNIFDMSLHAGALMDLGIYCVYCAVDMLGKPKKIHAAASFLSNGADGSGTVIFEYDSCNAVLTYSKTGQSVLGTEFVGDRGAVTVAMISQYTGISLSCGSKATELVGYPGRDVLMSGEANRFADYIRSSQVFTEQYSEVSQLTFDVHSCMDEIKRCADIRYE